VLLFFQNQLKFLIKTLNYIVKLFTDSVDFLALGVNLVVRDLLFLVLGSLTKQAF
jgi:hypothetical protein